MGTRPLIAAIATAAGKEPPDRPAYPAAPDIDSAIFRQIAENMNAPAAAPPCLLQERQGPAGFQEARRQRPTRRLNEGPLTVPGIYSIDVSEASTQALLSFNHSDYAERSHLLVDMGLIMKDGVNPPDLRFPIYKKVEGPAGAYWRYVRN
jgi:hypothetical protein